MFLSHASICRPVAMSCFIIVLILLGINSYTKLALDFFPGVDVPYVTITTTYSGASSGEIEVDIAKRIEDAVSTIDGIKLINSTAMENVCVTLLEFNLDVNVDVAAADVRERIDLIRADLPEGADDPEISKYDANAMPVVTMVLTGDRMLDELYDYADETLKNRISTIAGVGEVKIAGGEALELQVVLNKERLAAVNLTIPEIIAKLRAANVKIPAGRIKNSIQEITVTYDSEFKDFADMGALEIGKYKEQRIYLRDVAEIALQSNEKRSLAFFDGEPGIMIRVIKKGDANAYAVIEKIRSVVDEMVKSPSWPGGFHLEWVRDSGGFIKASTDDAWSSIAFGIGLTALILLAFLHEARSTFIVAVSMPVSIVITFLAMQLAGFSFNMFTLLALGTSVGTLVANSIVVIENIFKRLSAGDSPKLAADLGTAQVALPVFASAMTNVVVFVPIALMTSLVGRFLVPFAVVTTIVTLVSLFTSFTLTPILASVLLRREMPQSRWLVRVLVGAWNQFYERMERGFALSIDHVIQHPLVLIALIVAIFVAAVLWVAPQVGMTFVPDNDQNEFTVKLEYPTDYNLETTEKAALEVAARLRALPNVLRTATVLGKVQGTIGQATEGVYLAEISVVTTPKGERKESLEELRESMREILNQLNNCIVSINIPSAMGGSGTQLELKVVGDDLDTLKNTVRKLQVVAENASTERGPMATDIDSSVRQGKPEIRVVPKRTVLQNLGIDSGNIGSILRGSLEGIKAGTYKRNARSYDIRVKAAEQSGYMQINATSFGSLNGNPLSIEAVSTLQPSTQEIQINRSNRERIVKLYANPADGVGLNDLAVFLEREGQKYLPPGYRLVFTGMVEKMQEMFADFAMAILWAVVLTYLLIAAILESWTQPLMIMLTVPLALIGVWGALWITGTPLSLFGMLGFVMLIGIVVNNAILIMDDVALNLAAALDPKEAMRQAVKNKFRPIMMTSIAAVLGILPMALGTGLGAESRASCGIAVIGGLFSSTVLSLYVIPALYVLIYGRRKHPASPPAP